MAVTLIRWWPHPLLAVLGLTSSCARAASTVEAVFGGVGGSDAVTFGPSLVALALMALGLVGTFTGYRWLRACVFLGASVGGGYAIAGAVDDAIDNDESKLAALASWATFFAAGAVVGAIAVAHYRVAIAAVGAFGGVVLAYIVHIAWDHLVILAIVFGILGALAAWKLDRIVLILSFSVAGAGIVIYTVGYFAGGFPNTFGLVKFWAKTKLGYSWSEAMPGAWWGYLAAFFALAIAGSVVQFLTTSKPSRSVEDDWTADHSRRQADSYEQHPTTPV